MNNSTTTPPSTTAIVEGILLLEEDYISIEETSRISGLTPQQVERAITELNGRYHRPCHGYEIDSTDRGYLMIPKKEVWEIIGGIYKKKKIGSLSKAAVETLTIIAYSQPVTRAGIESVRGANSDSSVHFLLKQRLIQDHGTLKAPGNPSCYVTTNLFLKLFNLKSLKELPLLNEKETKQFQNLQ